ncbi:hypothetical protein ACWXWU_05085 [Shewanella sp. A14]
MSVEVNSIEELKSAMNSGENEIISYESNVVMKLKAVKLAKSWGPVAVAGIIMAIPLVITTGPLGAGLVAAAAPTAGVATSTIVALVIAIGGVIAINLFTDWDYVELPGGIKMKRKSKN